MIFWTFTELPSEIILILEKDIKRFDNYQKSSNVSQFDLQTFDNLFQAITMAKETYL